MRDIEQDFTPRLRQILLILLKEEKAFPVQQLAEEIQVSKRTVQRELEYIEQALKTYDLKFCSKTGRGVWIEGEETKRNFLLEQLKSYGQVDVTDRNQRRKRLILEILKDRDLKKLYYYSNLLGVSEATISSDLEAVESWFESFGLKIIRRQGYGVTVEGTEKDYRWAMRSFIEDNIKSEMLQEFYENKNLSVFQMFGERDNKNIYAILNNDILKRVVTCLLSLNDHRIRNLTENSYIGLVIHITIAINRIIKAEIIEPDHYLLETLQRDEDYEFAVYITEMLEKEFEVKIPEIESAYICLHIQGAKRQQIEAEAESQTEEDRELTELTYELIDAYDSELAYVLKQDAEFVSGLMAHLQPTFVRLKNRMKITNPLLEQIKKDYPDIFEKCRNLGMVLEQKLDCDVPEAEIGFLAIHFGAAVVKQEQWKETRRKVYVGIVCASGIGISRLMSTKVKKHFLNRVEIDTYGKADLVPDVMEKIDFLVSTVPLEQNGDIIQVSPLLSNEELDEIERRIQKYEKLPRKNTEEESFHSQLDEIHYIAEQIKCLLQEMKVFRVRKDIEFTHLVKKIAMTLAGRYEQEQSIETDLLAREKNGSQIFPQFGFGLLHAKTKGVEHPVFSIFLPEQDVQFKEPYFKGVGAVICMLFPEDVHVRENTAMLGYLSEVLVDELDFFDAIIGGDEAEIRELLSKYLKRFFAQYMNKM